MARLRSPAAPAGEPANAYQALIAQERRRQALSARGTGRFDLSLLNDLEAGAPVRVPYYRVHRYGVGLRPRLEVVVDPDGTVNGVRGDAAP